ncbi:hypothetical protein [Streptomyces sp. 4F14]|uniref:hypothetical protein n=1 Tax=Streptomyces sp. 4F14 TaxID=3394380 RepID=UPI003A8458E4
MNDDAFLETTRRFARRLAELRGSLDPEAYALLLRILKGTNEALVHRDTSVDIDLSDREQELFTPEFGERLRELLDLLGPLGAMTSVDLDALTGPEAEAREAERERLRREVEAIARASGLPT